MNNAIGFLDSGIGGINVLKEFRKMLPFENYIYYGDSKNNPYGDLSYEELYNKVEQGILFLLSKNCKAIVVACTTASTKILDKLKKKYQKVIFIGTYPSLSLAITLNKNNEKILLMATEGTIKSDYIQKKKKENKNLLLLPCSGLADIIENNKEALIVNYLDEKLLKYKDENISSVVLGCTHYPFIKDLIKSYFKNANILYEYDEMVKELINILSSNNLLNNKKIEGKVTFYNSLSEEKAKLCEYIFNKM